MPKISTGFLLLVAVAASAATFEVPQLGLRIENFNFPSPNRYRREPLMVARVVSVQENGPGHRGGVAPGDVIRVIGGVEAVPANGIPRLLERYRQGTDLHLVVSYPIPGGWSPGTVSLTVTVSGASASGRWISEVPRHTASGRAASTPRRSAVDTSQTYQEVKKEMLAAVVKDACRLTMADINNMAAGLASLAKEAGVPSDGDVFIFAQTRRAACEKASGGGMSHLETALWAMTDARRLNPCSYSPTADYSAIFDDPSYQMFQAKTYYDSGGWARFRLFLDQRATEEQKECFLELVRARITSRPARLSAPAPTPIKPSASEPAKPVLAPPVRTKQDLEQSVANAGIQEEWQRWNTLFEQARAAAAPINEAIAVQLIQTYWGEFKSRGDRNALRNAQSTRNELLKRLETRNDPLARKARAAVQQLTFLSEK